MFLLSRVAWDFNVHRAYLFAFPTGDAFLFLYLDMENGKIAHRLHKNRNWANVFTEGSVVFALIS